MSDPCKHCMIKCSDIEDAITAGCDTMLVKQLRTENAAQAQEIDELKRALELTQQAERMNYDLHNIALSKLIELDKEHDELKARVNELRDALGLIVRIKAEAGAYVATAQLALINTPAQSLAAHDAAIEEEVIERCIDWVYEYSSVGATQLRNQPRKYSGEEDASSSR